jgi:hypothetical protein
MAQEVGEENLLRAPMGNRCLRSQPLCDTTLGIFRIVDLGAISDQAGGAGKSFHALR